MRLGELEAQLEQTIPRHPETEEARAGRELVSEWIFTRLQDKPEEERRRIIAEADRYLAELDLGERR